MRDVATGGVSADFFVFDTALNSSNIDKITDFKVVDDTIVLDSDIFAALTAGDLSPSVFGVGSAGAALDVHIATTRQPVGCFMTRTDRMALPLSRLRPYRNL